MATPLQRLRIKVLAAAVEAEASGAPEKFRDDLAVAVEKLSGLGAGHLAHGAEARAQAVLDGWNAWKAALQG